LSTASVIHLILSRALIRRKQDNKLVLLDFGAVKQVQTQLVTAQGQPTASIAIGTPGYMPTEQGQGKPRPNSDIYALGIIGIQALTKMSPMQLQTLEDPHGRAYLALGACQPGWRRYCQRRCATTSKTATSQQKKRSKRCSAQWLHPYPASEHNMVPLESFATSPISGQQRLNSPDNHQEPQQVQRMVAGASSPVNGRC